MEDINYFNKFTHEIKNPLTICNGYLDMILKCDEKDKDTYLKIVKEEIKRSLNIIDNYKDLLVLNKTKFNLYNLLLEMKNNFEDLYDCKIELICNKQINYYGDYLKLKQVFLNIIKNSYESKSNRKLVIVIEVLKDNNYYTINIVDNGKGMIEEILKNIDKEYFTTKSYGTGLGIPYIKEIIKLHDGSIEYSSQENVGTKIKIKLKSPKDF